jgi:hypothetical protein
MEKSYYCPDCSHKLERMSGCGSVSYFCHYCKAVVSRKRIISEENMIEAVAAKVVEELNKRKE